MGTLFSLSKSTALSLLDVSEWALLIFGVILVVGLIIEYRSEHDSWLMNLGGLLVIIGVFGELLGDGGVFLFSRHLQSISDQEIIDLTKTAGDAKSSASQAADAASRADTEANRAKDAAGMASAMAEDEQGKRIRLAELLNPRSLSDQDIKDIADELRPFSDKDITIYIVTTSGNGRGLGISISNALKDAGFNPVITRPSNQVWYETNVDGPLELWPIVTAISKALGKRIPLYGTVLPLPKGSPIVISVGDKMVGRLPAELLSGIPTKTTKHKIKTDKRHE